MFEKLKAQIEELRCDVSSERCRDKHHFTNEPCAYVDGRWTCPTCAVFLSVRDLLTNNIKEQIMYELTDQDLEELKKRFTYHAPKNNQPERYIALRDSAYIVGELILRNSPKSREQALALTNLEQAIFWANAAIARNE